MIERIPMVNVTARIADQAGRPVQRARITMRLTTVERYCGLIVPREVTQYTDANGLATLRVWPNELGTEGSEYSVTLMYGDASPGCPNQCGSSKATFSQRFLAVVPNADCNLFDIANLPPYEQRGSGLVISSEVANYAAQAASAADRAQLAAGSVDTAKADMEAQVSAARLAQGNAELAAANAAREAARAQAIVEGVDSTILHFEASVVERTEKTASQLGQKAAACIRQEETSALDALERRSGEILTEISRAGADEKLAGRNAVEGAKEAALLELGDLVEKARTDFREEAGLFGADFEALTERAETAAKRAGCSAASAANAAARACLCADRAENAAEGIEHFRDEALIAARQVEAARACAEAAASRAERSADMVQQKVEFAAGSAKAALEAAKAAECSALLAKESAGVSTEAVQVVRADKELTEKAAEAVKDLLPKIEDDLQLATEVLSQGQAALDEIKRNAGLAGDAADKAGKAAKMAARQVETGEELLKAATQGASDALLAAEQAKADAGKTAQDRATVENLAQDVEQQIRDAALKTLTEEVVNEAVASATRDAQEAAAKAEAAAGELGEQAAQVAAGMEQTALDREACELAAKAARTEAINANIRAKRAQDAQEAAEEAARVAQEVANQEVSQARLAEMAANHIRLSDNFTISRFKQIEQNERLIASLDDEKNSRDMREAEAAKISIAAMDRLTRLELAFLNGNFGNVSSLLSAAGYQTLSGATIAPIAIVKNKANAPANAAIGLKLTEIKE